MTMPEFNLQKLTALRTALTNFQQRPLSEASTGLLSLLGYKSEKTADLGSNAAALLANIEQFKPELGNINRDKIKAAQWKSCAFLFQLTNDEIPSLLLPSPAGGRGVGGEGLARSLIESFVFLAIELQGEGWSRTDLAAIARELNRRFPMPAIVIFKHGNLISLVVIDRRANLKDAAKDVIDSRITVIKDVRIANPHRAHLDILAGLALENLGEKRRPTNFRELYDAWITALSTQALNKRFYQELANWYFWALTQAEFPKDAPKDADGRDSLSLIRLITRIIFCWFLKEKGLLPDALFDPRKVATLLGDYNPAQSTYYKAILQNLFFATLNQEMDKRMFRKAGQNFMAHNLYRYRSLMKNPDEVLKLLAGIPFMNGGLFECLDKTLATKEKPTYVRIDGFSDRDDNPLKIPNELFFGEERIVDLSEAYGDNKFKSAKVTGLIHILDRYKFTVAENTPIEEEVALDPELLGKVFENLLAAYNPETGATARKQTGSFYTPREIVNYMVDESLIASLKTKLEAADLLLVGRVSPSGRNPTSNVSAHDDVRLRPSVVSLSNHEAANPTYNTESRLRHLFAYNDQPHPFSAAEVETLIEAIDHLKILDPACGSGAFPMGVLHKMVFVLGKLDPHNQRWKARQIAKASEISDATIRERALDDIEQTFASNELDYGRKLYLIENCIYGVDIQPIAVQISKLRFFISLVVEQKINTQADNRGIRPLPNLETKFVAANTLIGIERPGQQMLRNPDIDIKEAELRKVREDHFLAKTPTNKRKCREQDATLRAEIAELLKSDGWNTATACALAEWNPYDQNMFANFFDIEWMFGLTDGFDVCLGNPPYGVALSPNDVRQLSLTYPSAKKVPDSYCFFILKAFDLLRAGGFLTFIVPNTFCDLENGSALREHLLETTRFISIWQSGLVFEAAVVDTLVFFAQKSKPQSDSVLLVTIDGQTFPRRIAEFLGNSLTKIDYRNPPGKGDLLRKIQALSISLGEIAEAKAGVKMYEKGKGAPPQTEKIVSERPYSVVGSSPRGWKPLYRGADVTRYSLGIPSEFVHYGPWLAAPRNTELFQSPKILMRRTDDRLMSAIENDSAICVNSCHVIKFKPMNKLIYTYEFLVGILNARLTQYVFETSNPQMIGKVFSEIKVAYVERLAIPRCSLAQQEQITRLVQRVMVAKNGKLHAEASKVEREIDEFVYRIYGLTPEEICVVEEFASPPSSRKQATQEIESKP